LAASPALPEGWPWLGAAPLSAARAPPPLAMAVAIMIASPRMLPNRCRAFVVICFS
jgi:hypothetical protein